MNKVTALKGLKDGSVQGVVHYLSATKRGEYYAQEGEILPDAKWLGKNSEALNDASRDGDMDFAKLLAGFNPETGEQWATRSQKSVMAFDVTNSGAKPFSIAFAMEHDEERRGEMVKAFERANEKALAYGTEQLTCRTGKKGHGPPVKIDQLFIRSVMHMDSREGEPQVHFHNVIVNSAVCEDGKVRTLDARDLYNLQKTMGAVFDREIAREFEGLGFAVTREEKRDDFGKIIFNAVDWGIQGIDQNAIDAFSTRRKQILRHVDETGDDNTKAALATRAGKDKTPSEILQDTRERVQELHQTGRIQFQSNDDLRAIQPRDISTLKFGEMLTELHAMESKFTRNGLMEAVMNHGAFNLTPADVDNEMARLVTAGHVVELQPDRKGQARYCSMAELALQERNASMAIVRKDETRHHLGEQSIQNALEAVSRGADGVTLSTEQEQALRAVCCVTGGIAVVTGQAGTGKTTFTRAVCRAFEEEGFRMIGTSTSQVATDNLKTEAGIEAHNATSLIHQLNSNTLTLTSKDVLVIDEGGMFGAKNYNAIATYAEKAGAKILAIGDANQLQPIEAGNPFKVLCNELSDSEQRLSEIRRQKTPELLAIANAFYDKTQSGSDIIAKMEEQGCLTETQNQAQAIKKLVDDYRKSPLDQTEKLILSQTHKEGKAITEQIRQQRQEAGELGERKKISVRVGEEQNKTEEWDFAVNDRVRFTRNNRDLKIANGVVGTIKSFGENSMEVLIDGSDKPLSVLIDQKKNFLDYGYARTCHSAQGLGAKDVYWLGNGSNMTHEMGLVAFTRTKENFGLYASKDNVEKIKSGLDNHATKESAMDLLKPQDYAMSRLRIESEVSAVQHKQKKRDIDQRVNQSVETDRKHWNEVHAETTKEIDQFNRAKAERKNIEERLREVAQENGRKIKSAETEIANAGFLMKPFKKSGLTTIQQEAKKTALAVSREYDDAKAKEKVLTPGIEVFKQKEDADHNVAILNSDVRRDAWTKTLRERTMKQEGVPEHKRTFGDAIKDAVKMKQEIKDAQELAIQRRREADEKFRLELEQSKRLLATVQRLDKPFVPVEEKGQEQTRQRYHGPSR